MCVLICVVENAHVSHKPPHTLRLSAHVNFLIASVKHFRNSVQHIAILIRSLSFSLKT